MELKELVTKTSALFSVGNATDLGPAIMKCVMENDTDKMQSFYDLVDGDLSVDWLQMIYQYYCAERKDKKQDYTPKSLALFLSRLIGDSSETIDMCSGSGALTIQRWMENRDTVFTLYELDENVIPFLLLNLALRNIHARIYQADVLEMEVSKSWEVRKGERFGKVTCIKSAV